MTRTATLPLRSTITLDGMSAAGSIDLNWRSSVSSGSWSEGYVTFIERSNATAADVMSRVLIPRNFTPRAWYFWYVSSSAAVSSRQGAHQEPQTLITTTSPLSWSSENFCPSSVVPVSFGAATRCEAAIAVTPTPSSTNPVLPPPPETLAEQPASDTDPARAETTAAIRMGAGTTMRRVSHARFRTK